jgi:hypothetical protein
MHYMKMSATKGNCFGTDIDGDGEPQHNKRCQGKYFKPKYESSNEDKNKP